MGPPLRLERIVFQERGCIFVVSELVAVLSWGFAALDRSCSLDAIKEARFQGSRKVFDKSMRNSKGAELN